jgi:hypothetical protein
MGVVIRPEVRCWARRIGTSFDRWLTSEQVGQIISRLLPYRLDKADRSWSRGIGLLLFSKPITQRVEAEKRHNADFAVKTL